MKKVMTYIMIFVMVLSLVACKSSNIGQDFQETTQQILNVAESYLNGEIDAETAEEKAQRFVYRYHSTSDMTEQELSIHEDVKELVDKLGEAKHNESLGTAFGANVINDVYVDKDILEKCDAIKDKLEE